MNSVKTEDLSELITRVETNVFVTDKEKFDKIPSTRKISKFKSKPE